MGFSVGNRGFDRYAAFGSCSHLSWEPWLTCGERRKLSSFAAAAGLSIISTILLYFVGPGQVVRQCSWCRRVCRLHHCHDLLQRFPPRDCSRRMDREDFGHWLGNGIHCGLAALLCMAFMAPSVCRGKSPLSWSRSHVRHLCSAVIRDASRFSGTLADLRAAPCGTAFLRLLATFKEIRSFRTVFVFLFGYFLCQRCECRPSLSSSRPILWTHSISGVRQNVMLLMLIQLSAAAGSVATGFIAKWIGALQTVILTIVIWIGALLGIFAFSSTAAFYVISVCAGLVLGGNAGDRTELRWRANPGGKAG